MSKIRYRGGIFCFGEEKGYICVYIRFQTTKDKQKTHKIEKELMTKKLEKRSSEILGVKMGIFPKRRSFENPVREISFRSPKLGAKFPLMISRSLGLLGAR